MRSCRTASGAAIRRRRSRRRHTGHLGGDPSPALSAGPGGRGATARRLTAGVVGILDADPSDGLALALARLARTIGAANS